MYLKIMLFLSIQFMKVLKLLNLICIRFSAVLKYAQKNKADTKVSPYFLA